MVLSVCYGLRLDTRLTPYNLPWEPLQCRHMGVKPCQTNWACSDKQKKIKAPHYNLFETKIHGWPVDTLTKACVVEAFSCADVIISQENSYIWGITRIMIMKTHCFQLCRCHGIVTSHGIDTSYHQTFVREIGPWITFKRIRNVSSCRWFDTPWCSCDVTVMKKAPSTLMSSSHLWN